MSVLVGGVIPLAASFIAVIWFYTAGRLDFASIAGERFRSYLSSFKLRRDPFRLGDLFVDVTTGLRDFDVILNLIKFYSLSLAFLASVFLIFTAFELWKFAGTIDRGIILLLQYLFYLAPFIYLQLAPSSAMLATLATYVIKSRQNEIVTWTSAGQSVYRLLLPCMLFMILLGAFNWQVQERVFPRANQIQDELRSQIRSRGILQNRSGRLWVANERRIFSFELDTNASDNVPANVKCSRECAVKNLTIYQFADNNEGLQSVYRVPRAGWELDKIVFKGDAEKVDLVGGKMVKTQLNGGEVAEDSNPFAEARKKPSQLNTAETADQVRNSESDVEKRTFAVRARKEIYDAVFAVHYRVVHGPVRA